MNFYPKAPSKFSPLILPKREKKESKQDLANSTETTKYSKYSKSKASIHSNSTIVRTNKRNGTLNQGVTSIKKGQLNSFTKTISPPRRAPLTSLTLFKCQVPKTPIYTPPSMSKPMSEYQSQRDVEDNDEEYFAYENSKHYKRTMRKFKRQLEVEKLNTEILLKEQLNSVSANATFEPEIVYLKNAFTRTLTHKKFTPAYPYDKTNLFSKGNPIKFGFTHKKPQPINLKSTNAVESKRTKGTISPSFASFDSDELKPQSRTMSNFHKPKYVPKTCCSTQTKFFSIFRQKHGPTGFNHLSTENVHKINQIQLDCIHTNERLKRQIILKKKKIKLGESNKKDKEDKKKKNIFIRDDGDIQNSSFIRNLEKHPNYDKPITLENILNTHVTNFKKCLDVEGMKILNNVIDQVRYEEHRLNENAQNDYSDYNLKLGFKKILEDVNMANYENICVKRNLKLADIKPKYKKNDFQKMKKALNLLKHNWDDEESLQEEIRKILIMRPLGLLIPRNNYIKIKIKNTSEDVQKK